MRTTAASTVRKEVWSALLDRPRAVLAVSGGLDSMVLLDAAAAVAADAQAELLVATYDHGTGQHATDAAELVVQRAAALGLPFVTARGAPGVGLATEAEWRARRWRFLNGVAAQYRGAVLTAHTRDDQVETVLMRELRDAGARGLAGLAAPSRVGRPLLSLSRADVERYARERELVWVDDPSNVDTRFLRNRVRRDLLPALRRVRPGIDAELFAVGERAAAWRADVDAFAEHFVRPETNPARSSLDVAAQQLTGYSPEALSILWPAVLARIGVALDRRGTARIVEFTSRGRVGSRIQLSGGWQVLRSRQGFEVRRSANDAPAPARLEPLSEWDVLQWGAWSFRPAQWNESDLWTAVLPRSGVEIRPWRPGDRLAGEGGGGGGGGEKKVKELLSKYRVSGHIRGSWPVVLSGDQIIWVPGIGRNEAATERSGRPGVSYRCDYVHS